MRSIKRHVELRGTDPLKAVIAGTNLKAYLVAQSAIGFDADTAIDQYYLDPADIYAALAFYFDILDAINHRLIKVEGWLGENAVDGHSKLEELQKRL